MAAAPRPIRLLPDPLINQIAAGEVVERPASIVKELIENSLDAGASAVRVELGEGGIELLSVADDGHGIPPAELGLALTRHCTSKIASAGDLEHIVSLGFRGEALASIAAVARVELLSRTAGEDHAWLLAVEPGRTLTAPVPASRARGTTVTVRDLFATLPARRQFLRRATTETLVIQQLLRGLAFCMPAIGFTLALDARRQWQALPARDERSAAQRWKSVFGAEFAREARWVDVTGGSLRVSGWIGGPLIARAQTDLQYLAVNGRLVRDRHLAHAVRVGFGETLPPGRHASYALHLELPPEEVDVNVHPSKTEVRFRALREVHDLVHAITRESLRGGDLSRANFPHPVWAVGEERSAPPAVAASAPPARWPRAPTALTGTSGTARSETATRLDGDLLPMIARDGVLEILDLRAALEGLSRDGESARRALAFPPRLPAPPGPTAGLALAELATFGLEAAPVAPSVWVLRAVPDWLPELDERRLAEALAAEGVLRGPTREQLIVALLASLQIPEDNAARLAWREAWHARLTAPGLAPWVKRVPGPALRALFETP